MVGEGLVVDKLSRGDNIEYKFIKGSGTLVWGGGQAFKRPSKEDTEKEQSSGLQLEVGMVHVPKRRGSDLSGKCHWEVE